MTYLPSPSPVKIDPAYNARKAAQIIAFFAMKQGGKIHIVKAMKLVYLSDRASMEESGFPILMERRVSMRHGPVNSETYRFAGGEFEPSVVEENGWAEFLEDKEAHDIAISKPFTVDELDELSEAETDCMEGVWHKFGHMNEWQLRDWTHDNRNIPEWEDPQGSSTDIPLSRILGHVGISDVDEQIKRIEGFAEVKRMFASLRRASS